MAGGKDTLLFSKEGRRSRWVLLPVNRRFLKISEGIRGRSGTQKGILFIIPASAEKWAHFPESSCIIPISGEYPLVPYPEVFKGRRW